MPSRAARVLLPWVLALGVSCGAPASPPPQTAPPPVLTAAPGDAPPAPAADPLAGWEKIRDEDGIVVHRKEVEGSPLVAFRGEGVIDAPIARVAIVQMDLEHAPEWIDRLVEARVLEVRSDAEYVTYSHVGAPVVVSDRDFVNRATIEFAPPDRIKFNLQSVDDPPGPKTSYVRGKLLHSSFELTALDPSHTRIVCEIHADPRGSLPKWVVNLFQKGWAYKTIMQLRKQVTRPDVVDRAPRHREVLQRNGFSP
jgi:hypothetical protein